MDDIRSFLAHAVKLEAEAARRLDELAQHMAAHGNHAVEALFRRFAEFSRLHLKEAMVRAGFRDITDLPEEGYDWPGGVPPEAAPWCSVDTAMGVELALLLALESEQGGLDFYDGVAVRASDPRVQSMARMFAEEEAAHIAQLEAMLAGHRAG